MLKRIIVTTVFALMGIAGWAQQDQDQLDYIERYKDIAIREMERAGIPASIKLAQGILESNSGKSMLARRANNHFGIKCGSGWEGRTVYREDDDYDAEGRLIKSCFRAYRNADASYIAHSEFLRDPLKSFRYGFLFRLNPKDYRRWAHGLKQAGYATSATYPEKLITIIERYELNRYDNMSAIDVDAPSDIVEAGILQNNDVRYVVAAEGETLDDIARRVDVSVRNLIEYNEMLSNSTADVGEGERVYIQPKRKSYRGREKYHVVQPGETMFVISQEYGVRLSKLYNRNRLEEGQEPAVNERIKLRGCKLREAPRLRSTEEFLPVIEEEPIFEDEMEMEEPDDVFKPETQPVTPPVTTNPSPTTTPPPATTNPPTTTPTTNPPNSTEVPVIIIQQPPNNPSTTSPPTTQPPPPVVDDTPPPPVVDNPPTTSPEPAAVYHSVQQGDTLWNIAQRYGTNVESIKVLNQMTSNTIRVGDRLRVQ